MELTRVLTKRLLQATLLGGVLLVPFSCVDERYDLENGVSGTVNVGGNLTAPIGRTAPIYLRDLIDASEIDLLSTDAEGKYAITMADSTTFEVPSLGGEAGLAIEQITLGKSITKDITELTSDIASFVIDEQQTVGLDMSLEPVEVGDRSEQISTTYTLSPEIPSELTLLSKSPAGIPAPEVAFDASTYFTIERSITPDVTCPDEVKSIHNLQFGEAGTIFALTLSINPLSDGFDDFEWRTPTITLAFPDGFLLSNGKQRITFEPIVQQGGQYVVSTQIMKYTKPLVPIDGEFPTIGGTVEISLSGDIDVLGGTTNGKGFKTTGFMLGVKSDPLRLTDTDLDIEGMELPIASTVLMDELTINDIPNGVGVHSITFKEEGNDLAFEISKVQLPTGLKMPQNETLKICFPKSSFGLGGADVVDAGDHYTVDIQASDLVTSTAGTIRKSVKLNKVIFNDANSLNNGGSLLFSPNVTLQAATLQVGGSLSLKAYNEYASKLPTVDVAISAKNLTVKDADAENYVLVMERETERITLKETLPSELVALYGMTFSQEVKPKFALSITGLPSGVTSMKFKDYMIQFPQFIEFAPGVVDAKNRLIINDEVEIDAATSKGSYIKEFAIEGLDFTSAEYDNLISTNAQGENILKIDEEVSLSGEVVVDGTINLSGDLSVTAAVDFTMPRMEVATVVGKIHTDISNIKQSIDLSEFMDELPVDHVSMSLSNPTIFLKVNNPFPLGVSLDKLQLVPYKYGIAQTPIALKERVDITSKSLNTIFLSGKVSDLPNHYQIENLGALLKDMPDSIAVEVSAATLDKSFAIDMNKDYLFDMNYAVNIPLAFDELSIDYDYTIEDLADALADVVELVPTLDLLLEIENSLPFSLIFDQVVALDAQGKELENLPNLLPEATTIEGGDGTNASTSTLQIHIENNSANDLARLDAIAIKIGAAVTSTNGGVALQEDQYIRVGAKVRLPEGVNLDLLEGDGEGFED